MLTFPVEFQAKKRENLVISVWSILKIDTFFLQWRVHRQFMYLNGRYNFDMESQLIFNISVTYM